MNQQNPTNKLLVDNRTKEDILADIRQKAKSYVPEWNIDENNPDIGYAIAKVFANQMEDNIDRINQVLDNYHTEFINMLDISPKSARPARGLVEFTTTSDTVSGTYIPKGTKLRAGEEEGIIFETQHSLYVTGSKITRMFMVDGDDGYIRPLKGHFDTPSLLPSANMGGNDEENDEVEAAVDDPNFYNQKEFRLFGEEESIAGNSIYFYHNCVVNSGNNPVFIKLEGNEQLISDIDKGDFEFSWYTTKGLKKFKDVRLRDDNITFELIRDENDEVEPIMIGGKEYYLIALEAKKPIRKNMPISKVSFSSMGNPLPIGFATDGSIDFDSGKFLPFGEELSPFSQCYIGMENYFEKAGAKIELEFDVTYGAHTYDLNAINPDGSNDLKVIKKKPRIRNIDMPADCVINEISVEYFNGNGWKKLETDTPMVTMFSEKNQGRYRFSFICPVDWEKSSSGPYFGRMIKLQIIQADNCYLRPCTHYFPIISDFKVSYSYEDRYLTPIKAKAITGTKITDFSKAIYASEKFNIFATTEYFNDSLYMGFSRPFDNGPISIMFEVEEVFNNKELKYVFEYSGSNGFKQMKVLDTTSGMTCTGVITFLPQPDMSPMPIEGKSLYWIRMVRTKSLEEEKRFNLPLIKGIRLNVTEVANIDEREEADYFIDSVTVNQTIALNEDDILDVDLWVNELGFISSYELDKLQLESPEDVKVEYDMVGNMTSCYIRYKECNSFDIATEKRVYILDRINSEVLFGDGIKTATPRVLDDVALKIKIRKSQGSRGNSEANTLNQSVGNLVFIEGINNPLKIYNGSDMENVGSVLERGALLLQSRNRLLSADDYRKEIVLYTDAVYDMEIICEEMKNKKTNPLAVSCVLLLKDYNIGKGAFDQIGEGIKKHLLENCEITVNEDNLHIVDPIFVDISVDIWAESINIDESFEMQNLLKENLAEYLCPLNGWKIGTLPKVSQIMMRLNVLKSKAVVKKAIIVAKYVDQDGEHEMDLKNVEISPYMICRSGNHNVHVIISN